MSRRNSSDSSDDDIPQSNVAKLPRLNLNKIETHHNTSRREYKTPIRNSGYFNNPSGFPMNSQSISENHETSDFSNPLKAPLPSFKLDPSSPTLTKDARDFEAEESEKDDIEEEETNSSHEMLNPKRNGNRQVEFYDSDSSDDPDLNTTNEMDITELNPMEDGGRSSLLPSSSQHPVNENFTAQFKRKMSLRSTFKNSEPSGNDSFLSRFFNGPISGGGMVPGASKYEGNSANPPIEEEREIGMDRNDIEMMRLNPEDFKEEAEDLLKIHMNGNNAPSINTSINGEGSSYGGSTLNRSSNNSFLVAPNPDLYLRGNPGEFDDEMNLDDGGDYYVAPPKHVQAGVLSSLLRLYQHPAEAKSSATFSGNLLSPEQSPQNSRPQSVLDFTKWGKKKLSSKQAQSDDEELGTRQFHKRNISSSSIAGLLFSHNNMSMDELTRVKSNSSAMPSFLNTRPKLPKSKSASKVPKKNRRLERQTRITVHIADILQRQRFILRMCKALMLYGAPTHRLEEYMVMTSRVLEIDGQFVYMPGCMIVSFGDAATRTSEVNIVRCVQGLNLSKLTETHRIYKSVIHDLIGVEEASTQLEVILADKNKYPAWMCVLFYAVGSAMVAPYAFGGGWMDLPILFGIGCCVGILQFYVSNISNLYSSVFEVASSIVVSFISRAIGSINNGNTFCFSALAQGSLALILPGYIILCGSLELQSRNIVAGSVRMFYAIIYSLFLGFGITLGAALYGWIDKNATDQTTCAASHQVDPIYRIIFIPAFSISLALINQATWDQLPMMVVISGAGYVASYFSGLHFQQVTEFTAAIGAFVIGVLGNLYSRIGRGMAVSAMLPAIFVQVPSGIASQGSLLAGLASANKITGANDTTDASSANITNSNALSFGATMVEVSIGISVGLFAAALLVYPFGKKRTGLFTL